MKRTATFFFVIFISLGTFSQKKNQDVDIVSHQVQLGESVRLISKKYLVDPAEIYKLNKFAVNGISEGMSLRIPVPRKENSGSEIVQQTVPEIAASDETPIASIQKPSETEKVKPATAVSVIDRSGGINHIVKSKETIYSLSRKYGISVDEIKLSNPELGSGLKTGQVVKIPSTKVLGSNETSLGSSEMPGIDLSNTHSPPTSLGTTVMHTVAPKETLYSLSKKYNVPVEEIKQQNASLLQQGLQIGQVLTIKKGN